MRRLLVLATIAVAVLVAAAGCGSDREETASREALAGEIAFLAPPPGGTGADAVFGAPDCYEYAAADAPCGETVTEVWTVNADGSDRRRLTRGGGFLLEREYFTGVWDQPVWSLDGSAIAITRGLQADEGGKYGRLQFWTVDARGSRRIADGNWPAWSPDGSAIAFTRAQGDFVNGVSVVDQDGGDQRVLTEDGGFPEWSPDGSQLLYLDGTESVTWVVDTDRGGSPEILVRGDSASWSPDGRRIAYWKWSSDTWALFVADVDGSHEHRLVTADRARVAWSPDGTELAFVEATYEHDHAGPLRVVAVDGSRSSVLAEDAVGYASWSPDGRRIAFAGLAEPGEQVRSNRVAIYTVRPDGTGLKQVTDGPFDLHPAWRPSPSR